MIIRQAILTQLNATATLTAIVGARIYGNNDVPQTVTAPYVAFYRNNADRQLTHDGPGGPTESYFQFFHYASTGTVAEQIAGIVRGVLDGFRGTLGTGAGLVVGRCSCEDEVDDFDPDNGLRYIAQVFKFSHVE